jgi:D-aminopeptidase
VTRLRELGFAIGSLTTGPFNAITDVAGVGVGYATRLSGDEPKRTGVTVIRPRAENVRTRPLFAASSTLNGNGEMTGLEWVRESGLLTTCIGMTATHSVGVVQDALVVADLAQLPPGVAWSMPVVAETYDGLLNGRTAQHVRRQDVDDAIAGVVFGPIAEGNVGGGTGMTAHGFKAGTGTSSRVLDTDDGGWTVGVLVQANYGARADLRIDGVAVGRHPLLAGVPVPASTAPEGSGSIIVIVATDAPLLPDQCRRLAARAGIGVARSGGGLNDSSGDIFFAFATGNDSVPAEVYTRSPGLPQDFPLRCVPHQRLDPLFRAVVEATEEAIVNALLAAETMTGADDVVAHRLDPQILAEILTEAKPHR